jgi:uncharacterized protein (DUF983 family)
MWTPKHCPGYESFKTLKSFTCKCPSCGKALEIFSDEFDKPRTCKQCGKPIDFTRCEIEAST